jgi:anti-anti-sigma factor
MLQIKVHNGNEAAILACEGRIVLGQATTALESAAQAVCARSVILDLSRVQSVDAAGLGTLLRIKQRVESAGARLRLLNPPPLVRRMLSLTRLDKVLEIHNSEPATVGLRRWNDVFGHLRACNACV